MSVRVGHIMRHEDVHGVSGVGKVADVFEASNGKAMVVWLSAIPSVVVYDSVKAIEVAHGHGGKTEILWDWESPPDADPMDALAEAEKPTLTKDEIEDIASEAAQEVAQKTAAKVSELIAEKIVDLGAQVEETPSEKKEKNGKKAPKKPKPSAAKKKEPQK